MSDEADPFGRQSEMIPAAALLRSFEDEHLGEDAVRIEGQIERGHGSKFKAMTPQKQAEHGALEQLVAAEKRVADAQTALASATAAHDAALAKLAATAQRSDSERGG